MFLYLPVIKGWCKSKCISMVWCRRALPRRCGRSGRAVVFSRLKRNPWYNQAPWRLKLATANAGRRNARARPAGSLRAAV